jgi:hypothetical protein
LGGKRCDQPVIDSVVMKDSSNATARSVWEMRHMQQTFGHLLHGGNLAPTQTLWRVPILKSIDRAVRQVTSQ